MAIIGTNDLIQKFEGTTLALASSGSTAAIASGAAEIADQAGTVAWTNADDVEIAGAVLVCQFATVPTVGRLDLYGRIKAMRGSGSNDAPVPSANYLGTYCGTFLMNYGVAANTNTELPCPFVTIPTMLSDQGVDWYVYNNATLQSVTAGWALYLGTRTVGPHA